MLDVHKAAKEAREALVKSEILPKELGDIIFQYHGTTPVRPEKKTPSEEDVN